MLSSLSFELQVELKLLIPDSKSLVESAWDPLDSEAYTNQCIHDLYNIECFLLVLET